MPQNAEAISDYSRIYLWIYYYWLWYDANIFQIYVYNDLDKDFYDLISYKIFNRL